MKLFLDSAKIDEIKAALHTWNIDGLTTNPRHVEQSGKPMADVIREIGDLFAGTNKPVSVEVNPHLTDWEAIVDEARLISAKSPNFVVKIGMSEAGCRALATLSAEGIRTNATLIFSAAQAWHAARAGATYLSPFLGWKEAHGDVAADLVPEIAEILETHSYPAQIIAAAVRNSRQIVESAIAGAHCVTASYAVYQESFQNPYTGMGEKVFQNAWDNTPLE